MTKKSFFKILLLVVFIILLGTTTSKAAIYASNKTVNSGESVSISITSNVAVLSYKVEMTSNGGLTFVTSSGGTGAGTSVITDAKATGMKSLATYTFKAPTVTKDTTYKVTFSATAMEDENFNPVSNSTATATITVKAPAKPVTPTNPSKPSNGGNSGNSGNSNSKPTTPEVKKSEDSSLKALTVTDCELSPEFNSATKEYSLKVANEVTSIEIKPVVNDSKASYKITGAYQELAVGENTINVVVTAEDGTTSTYVIKAVREREALSVKEIKFSYVDSENNIHELKLLPEFDENIFSYNLERLSYTVSKIDVKVLTNMENSEIKIEGNEDLKTGENTIKITITLPSEDEEKEAETLEYTITVSKDIEPKLTLVGKIKKWFKGITGTIGTSYLKNEKKILTSLLGICSVALIGLTVYMIADYKRYNAIMAKIAEITRMNNAQSQQVNTTVEPTNTILETEKKEKIEKNTEVETETKIQGRHF